MLFKPDGGDFFLMTIGDRRDGEFLAKIEGEEFFALTL